MFSIVRSWVGMGTAALAAGLTLSPAVALDEVTFATNWLAEAEHGGFYQALADGTYERFGLKVTILQGGPQTTGRALLAAGQVEFYMSGNMLGPLNAAQQGIPLVEVAALFQRDPLVMITHPDSGVETFADLTKLPTLFLAADVFASTFQWLKVAYPGFRDEQYRPYSFTPAPFLADKQSAQQGYVTSEPFAVERQGGFKPRLFLLADAGFDTPSTLIEARRDYVAANPDIVQRFVDASIVGWYTYLYGDNSAGNALIRAENPEMTDEQIAFTVEKMKEYALLDSGVALEKGIGCIDGAQIRSFYDKMVLAGVIKAGLDIDSIFTTQFVCKGVGMDLRPR